MIKIDKARKMTQAATGVGVLEVKDWSECVETAIVAAASNLQSEAVFKYDKTLFAYLSNVYRPEGYKVKIVLDDVYLEPIYIRLTWYPTQKKKG